MSGEWDFGGAFADTARTLQTTDIERQKAAIDLEKAPVELQNLMATGRSTNATAAAAEHKLATEKQMASIVQGMTIDPSASQSATILKLAGAAAAAGDPTATRDLVLRATQTRAAEARDLATNAAARHSEVESAVKKADRYAQLMAGVSDQQGFNIANQIFESEFGDRSPVTVYDPATVNVLRQSSLKMADRIRQEHNLAMEKAEKARLAETRDYHTEMIRVRDAEAERKAEREKRLAAAGGKDVGAPQKVEVDQARDLLDREGKSKGLDAATQRTAAFDLASRAKTLRKQNPGLSAGEAMQRAFVEQVSQGYFVTQRATSWFGSDKATYGKPGGAAERALAVPADRATLKEQTYYQTPKGPLLYLGKGQWQAPSAASPRQNSGSGAASSGGGGGEDDDEEE